MPPNMLPSYAIAPVSPLLRDRKFALVVAGTAGVQIALVSLKSTSGDVLFPCNWNPLPRLWLDQGSNIAAKGDLQASLRFHAFAPIVLLTALALILVLLLPRSITQPAISKVTCWNRKPDSL